MTLYLAIVSVIIVPQKTSCLFRLSMVLTLYLAIVSVITVPQNNILLVSPEQGFAIVPSHSFRDNCNAKHHLACFVSAMHGHYIDDQKLLRAYVCFYIQSCRL